MLDFFAKLPLGLVNLATIISAGFGICFSIFALRYSVRLSRKLSSSTDKLVAEGQRVVDAIHKNTDAIHEHTQAIHRHTKILRIDNIRLLNEISREQSPEEIKARHVYWHFRWRFETFDRLGLIIQKEINVELTVVGHCDVYIKGFSNPADKAGFERQEPECYVVELDKVKSQNGEQLPFRNNDLAACFCSNGRIMLSQGIDPWTEEAQYPVMIGGIGFGQTKFGIPSANTINIHKRIKDA